MNVRGRDLDQYLRSVTLRPADKWIGTRISSRANSLQPWALRLSTHVWAVAYNARNDAHGRLEEYVFWRRVWCASQRINSAVSLRWCADFLHRLCAAQCIHLAAFRTKCLLDLRAVQLYSPARTLPRKKPRPHTTRLHRVDESVQSLSAGSCHPCA